MYNLNRQIHQVQPKRTRVCVISVKAQGSRLTSTTDKCKHVVNNLTASC